jgi:hypothetical protein
MKRIEVNAQTGESQEIDLTPEEIAQAEAQHAAWQVEETARLAAVAAEQARQAKFEEWLGTQQ